MKEIETSPVLRLDLIRQLRAANPERRHRPMVHEEGELLQVDATGIWPATKARLDLRLVKSVGGGFAGQVYQARLERIEGQIEGLEVGGSYAVKVLRPPSSFSLAFRNLMYELAYQGPFSAQVSEPAIRAGALWQLLLRRGAAVEFGSERAIVQGYATFFDPELCSWAEVSEWVPGRVWQLEIDDRMFQRWREKPTTWTAPREDVPSPEYLNKRAFMARLVRLFHRMGAPELARQYEWWSMKSQPNALKRLDAGDGPADGLTAIDFRAGLALLFGVPMSVVDIKLVFKGLFRGALVQFDRGDLGQLKAFMDQHADLFSDLRPAYDELLRCERTYRRSLPDLTHHRLRLLTDAELRRDVRIGLADAWRTLDKLDDVHAQRLRTSGLACTLYLLLGGVPLLGNLLRKLWGLPSWRRHLWRCLTSSRYLGRTLRAHQLETLLTWHRKGRVSDERLSRLRHRPFRLWLERVTVGWLPMSIHRFLTEPRLLWERLRDAVSFPFKIYFIASFREDWLREQVDLAKEEGMLDEEEERRILDSIDDPFIQTYLKCVAVHAATLPVTQVVAVVIAAYYYFFVAPDWAEGMVKAGAILAFFQATPVSPGSLTRGFYVLWRMLRDRNIRDYWLAALISFWHYVGYLGFPVQMVARFPGLARFMGGTWAARAARVIPVFGEKGALVEHMVWDSFFNTPIAFTALFRRKRQAQAQAR